jgi:23S rRNA (uracil1939-C5)-methyltransferase
MGEGICYYIYAVGKRKLGELLEKVLVEDYAAEGKSLTRAAGKVIFLENVVPGDLVDLRLTRNKKDWAEGIVTRIHAFSPDRVEPFCEHFGICGGCQWQMLPYSRQLAFKQKQVTDVLARIGKVGLPEIRPIIGAEHTTDYRNKIEYTFSNRRFLLPAELQDPGISTAQNVAGFHAKGIYDKIVDIKTCHLQEEPSNGLRLAIKSWAISHGAAFYDINRHQGWLRTVQIRICRSGEIMVNLVLGHEAPELLPLLDYILETFPMISTLLYTINSKSNDSLTGLVPICYFGKGYVTENLESFRFKIGPKSFFQTNTRQAERLYGVVRDLAGLTGSETLYDLYCGTGSMGIFLSKAARHIVGVELVDEAVQDACQNARLNGLHQAHFFTGDVGELCRPEFFEAHGRPDIILTDPPRAGMQEKLLSQIILLEPSKLIYVSCNPSTQARDIQRLDAKFRVTAVQPVDMFPHTHHIENVVCLENRG